MEGQGCSNNHVIMHTSIKFDHMHCSLHRVKWSVLPASALALSTALLMANRTEELRASGGSPTAEKQKYQL